jgi:DNA invertase Pin-like site-specific DNA recombinase
MSDLTKINSTHLSRLAYVYLRQSSAAQVEHNRESTARQYALVTKAAELGWPAQQVLVIDEDLGVSGSGVIERSGFARLTAEVALGHVGIVLGLEASRLARNNADWYRLLDLCGLTDTLIGDADGIYHPAMFNDRLVLGLKGTMSEAELHILRARLLGGIRNKAARGELRRGLPVGFVWGEEDGEVRLHPDAAVASAIRTIFARFAELGSVRRVWLWLRSEGLTFPMQTHYGAAIRWIDPSYTAIYHVPTNPVYAGAYVYGKSRRQITLDATGRRKRQIRKLPRSEWSVLIPEHHTGFIDWATYEANRSRIAANAHPQPHHSGGAVREGSALLQGLATCGACGRRLRTRYTGRTASPGYHCAGKNIVDGRGIFCLSVGQCRSTTRLHAPFSPRLLQRVSKPLSPPPNGSKPIATMRSPSAGSPLNVPGTRHNVPNAAIALSMRRTVSSPAASRASGSSACANSSRPKPSSPGANVNDREHSAQKTGAACSRSAPICRAYGKRRPPRRAIARSCCERCSKRSSSPCLRPNTAPASPCGGEVEASPISMSICHARNRQSCAPTRTQSPSFAVWPHITQTPSSPVSSTVKIVIPLTVTALPPTMSAVCGGSGTSRASSRPLPSPRASC